MIYMSPAEVFCALKKLLLESQRVKKKKSNITQESLRWHVPSGNGDHA